LARRAGLLGRPQHATSSGTAITPSARKNANTPVVKNTTWIACDTTITATTLNCSPSKGSAGGFLVDAPGQWRTGEQRS